MEFIKVFELYSGIGGMHFALKETELAAKVVRAIDINPVANSVYKLNFSGDILLEKNIQGLLADDFNKLHIDMIMMSPPCQPFTRNGLRKDLQDHRNSSILHIINLIPELTTVKYILLENVKGFECSNVRNALIHSLTESDFIYQEFLLTPEQFSIPNSRLRYYLLAKKVPLEFCFTKTDEVMLELPLVKTNAAQKIEKMKLKYKKLANGNICYEVQHILDEDGDFVPENVLRKYGPVLDIATSNSTKTCCFTKAYSHYAEGTGSVYTPSSPEHIQNVFKEMKQYERGTEEYVGLMKSLKLRYFTPVEISRLMSFPDDLKFPNHLTNKQRYKLLGNSVNVHVIAILTVMLMS